MRGCNPAGRWVGRTCALGWMLWVACAKSPPPSPGDPGGAGTGGSGSAVSGQIVVSAAKRTQRTGTFGLNYWQWAPTYGNNVAGTEEAVAALAPRFLRVGGHNNDNNSPDPFTAAEVDNAFAYAKAVGAEVILQVPLLGDEAGGTPTAANAARMVTDANVAKGHGIKYFSIGNEPDLYPDQEATRPGYTPADYCAAARPFVAAMKAADPSIKIVGPDLSWKYQPGNDWMTPILTTCGDLFDVVTFHRYPFAPTAATAISAESDAPALRNVIASLRAIMRTAGHPDKPLALTETNITYDGSPEKSTLDASPGTIPAGLWTADMLGTAFSGQLWTTLLWSISEGWTLGLVTPSPRVQRPAYHALALYAAHFGPTLIEVTSVPAGVHAYASRDLADQKTQMIVVNWSLRDQTITVSVTGTATSPSSPTFTVGARTFSAIEIPDVGSAMGWMYGAQQLAARAAPAAIAPGDGAP
jgi:hypothetical protein